MSAREREIAQAFDDGRESLAVDLLEWLEDYPDHEDVPASDLRLLIEELLGWDPDEDI